MANAPSGRATTTRGAKKVPLGPGASDRPLRREFGVEQALQRHVGFVSSHTESLGHAAAEAPLRSDGTVTMAVTAKTDTSNVSIIAVPSRVGWN